MDAHRGVIVEGGTSTVDGGGGSASSAGGSALPVFVRVAEVALFCRCRFGCLALGSLAASAAGGEGRASPARAATGPSASRGSLGVVLVVEREEGRLPRACDIAGLAWAALVFDALEAAPRRWTLDGFGWRSTSDALAATPVAVALLWEADRVNLWPADVGEATAFFLAMAMAARASERMVKGWRAGCSREPREL